MKPIQIIAGGIAGAIGAAIWAAIAYYANVEIGYIAWGIGILVGVAVAATGENSAMAGVVAVIITILSLVAGKYAAVDLAVQDIQAEMGGLSAGFDVSENEVTDEALQAFLANKIVDLREAAGESIDWPEVAEDDETPGVAYPSEIWKEAGQQLSQKTDDEKTALRKEHVAAMKELGEKLGQVFVDAVREDGFMNSFSMFDFLFFGLAVVTAWGIAARDE